jgi:hypothetical protein
MRLVRAGIGFSSEPARAESAARAIPLLLSAPPYHEFQTFRLGLADRLPFGTVLAVKAETFLPRWLAVQAAVQWTRISHPWAPVVWLVQPSSPSAMALLVAHAAGMRVRAVLTDGEDPKPGLTRQLCQPADLAGDVLDWLRMRGLALPSQIVSYVSLIISRGPEYATLDQLLHSLQVPERKVQSQFARADAPPPRDWWQAASAIRAALRLQADRRLAVARLAVELGRGNASPLTHQMVRAFGLAPTDARRILGWEPLMDRWVRRHWLRESGLSNGERRRQEALEIVRQCSRCRAGTQL